MGPAEPALIRIELCHSAAARVVQRVTLQLPAGSTVADALRAAGLVDGACPGAGPGPAGTGPVLAVWGRVVDGTTVLRDLDRVELLRPLLVDPKEARRQRYRRQGGGRASRALAGPR
jgi:uncharacterized protein